MRFPPLHTSPPSYCQYYLKKKAVLWGSKEKQDTVSKGYMVLKESDRFYSLFETVKNSSQGIPEYGVLFLCEENKEVI